MRFSIVSEAAPRKRQRKESAYAKTTTPRFSGPGWRFIALKPPRLPSTTGHKDCSVLSMGCNRSSSLPKNLLRYSQKRHFIGLETKSPTFLVLANIQVAMLICSEATASRRGRTDQMGLPPSMLG